MRRKYNPLTGDVAVAGVDDEAHAVQTAVGDLLFLKGNAFPGLFGEQQLQEACRWHELHCVLPVACLEDARML